MSDLEVLWLRTLQTVVDRAAHEIKDALNGVSLNIEVVRSRSRRADVAAADLAEFATAAGSQFETLVERTEGWPAGLYLATLSLTGRADPAQFVRQFSGTDQFVGDYLTEVNVTSPTGFREIQDQTGFDVAGMFLEALEGELA